MPASNKYPHLSPKQCRYVEEYLLDLNAAAASRRAGYESIRVSHNEHVRAAIQAEMDARSVRTHVRLDKVLSELQRLAFFDPKDLFAPDGTMLPIKDMPEAARRAIAGFDVAEVWEGFGEDRQQAGVLKKVKLLDRNAALDKLMRHLGAYQDRLELAGNLTLRDLIPGAKLPEPQAPPETTLEDELNGEV